MLVVDARCRVHGMEGLRVVDSSIMPSVVRGTLNAPTVMIGESVSDMVLGRTPRPREGRSLSVGSVERVSGAATLRRRIRPARSRPVDAARSDSARVRQANIGKCDHARRLARSRGARGLDFNGAIVG